MSHRNELPNDLQDQGLYFHLYDWLLSYFVKGTFI